MPQKLKEPILFLNFKTYKESTGKNAMSLGKLAEKISKKHKATIVLVAQPTDIQQLSKLSIPIFSQHIDPIEYGANTGFILPEAVKDSGAIGTILNHAENKRANEFIEKAVLRAKSVGLITMLCAETTERAIQLAKFNPDLIAVEPPELIGGNISVSTAKPEIISDSVKAVHSINPAITVICGAGVKTAVDVRKSLELGSKGVFVASGIIKAADQKKALEDLVSGFK